MRRPFRIALLAASLALSCAHAAPDTAWFTPSTESAPVPGTYSSQYLTMRDGVRIAADVWLPAGIKPGEKVPTILHQTRYFRSVRLGWLGAMFMGNPFDHTPLHRAARRDFVGHGYAWVDIDVRGSGASFGTQKCPFAPDEIRDAGEVVQWIESQPWSDGKIGSLGVSYDGSATDFLLINRSPAVVATAPLFASWDAYTDIAFPGGVRLAWFTKAWGHMNAALDANHLDRIAGANGIFIDGVMPVAGSDEKTLKEAIHDHAGNYYVDTGAQEIIYRDDLSGQDDFHRGARAVGLAGHPTAVSGTIGVFSAHTYLDDIAGSGAIMENYSGWFDGAYAHAAIKRFMTVRAPGSRLVLGPWSHGGSFNCAPPGETETSFNHTAELRRFFDARLKGVDTGIAAEKAVHYFTMVEGKWKSADTWPPPATPVSFYLAPNGSLAKEIPTAKDGADTYRVDPKADTGPHARWNTLVGGTSVSYPDRKAQDRKLLVYDSAALGADTEVTGHPVITLYVASTANDGDFFAYLEDIDPSGSVSYVTEGMLRALHRRISSDVPPYRDAVRYRSFERKDAAPMVPGETTQLVFDLNPVSYLFERGHKIRVAIAGADHGHFAPSVPGTPTITVQRTANYPSAISLPIVSRSE